MFDIGYRLDLIYDIFYPIFVLGYFYSTQFLPVIFPLYIFLLCNDFFSYKVLCTTIFHRRSLDPSLLGDGIGHIAFIWIMNLHTDTTHIAK